ncbi:MAG TPA: TetR/AcrR family transcriptional regulator [Ktedonobacteraceae bacterium]|nr:TetR/AcrR family transcriptional regulator [Ktedonobacteraceae bacterium]
MVASGAEQTTRKPGRPRSTQAHQAILEATLALFVEEGLQGLSMEAIAERAGVGKTTIYRRWSSKEAMIKDAFDLLRAGKPLPNTGNIRADLLVLARESREVFGHNPFMAQLMTRMIAELKTTPEIYRAFHRHLIVPRLEQFLQIIKGAQERGEVRPELDAMFVISLVFTTLVYGPLFSELIDPDAQHFYEPEVAVDALLRGIGTPSLEQH